MGIGRPVHRSYVDDNPMAIDAGVDAAFFIARQLFLKLQRDPLPKGVPIQTSRDDPGLRECAVGLDRFVPDHSLPSILEEEEEDMWIGHLILFYGAAIQSCGATRWVCSRPLAECPTSRNRGDLGK